MVIELPKPIAWALAIIALAVTCVSIGYAVTPHTTDGRPLLLSPEVRTVESYRRSALGWARAWRALTEILRTILHDEDELISTSQRTQQAFEKAVELAEDVDSGEAPASLIGLREQAGATSGAFVNASLATARWISAPSAENKSVAEDELALAERLLITLESNEWLRDLKRGN